MTRIYGIRNCDTMKKALNWLEAHNIAYEFHDYRRQGVDAEILRAAISQHGWEQVINRRGTSWRLLPAPVKNGAGAQTAIALASENPALIKRRLLHSGGAIHLGFTAEKYREIFR